VVKPLTAGTGMFRAAGGGPEVGLKSDISCLWIEKANYGTTPARGREGRGFCFGYHM